MVAERQAARARRTRETDVEVRLALDGSGTADVETGIPFLDHLLHALALHGRLDLAVRARGDLEVDAHHTVEDVALVMGQALSEALGERRGMQRFGDAAVPMDESWAQVALDCGGRPYALIDLPLRGPTVGTLPVSLLPRPVFPQPAAAGRPGAGTRRGLERAQAAAPAAHMMLGDSPMCERSGSAVWLS